MASDLPTALALIDGEHYPDVVREALCELSLRFRPVGAVFLGGTEKIKAGDLEREAESLYGLPVQFGATLEAGLMAGLHRWRPDYVIDLSDEPVLGYKQRFRLASYALAAGAVYLGSDFRFTPPQLERVAQAPSLSIIGTAKRVGKTALSGFVARTLAERGAGAAGAGVVVVAMGRGGPSEPEIVDGLAQRLTSRELLQWSRQGRHAASDHFEDAALSRVTTVGSRRCGGGLAGQPFVSNVIEAVKVANTLSPDLLILEGSGASIPPVSTNARLCVAGAHQSREYVVGFLGTYRLLTSDAVVLAMAEEPLASPEGVRSLIDRIAEVRPGIPIVPVVFRPRPVDDVKGHAVAFFSTAPAVQLPMLSRYLEDTYGCSVVMASAHLADRSRLREDLSRPEMKKVDLVLTEIKAAAIDLVAEEATGRGLPVVFVDNDPVEVEPAQAGELADAVVALAMLAKERYSA